MDAGGTSGLITVFSAQGSGTAGAGTADFGGTNQDGCIVSVAEFVGVHASAPVVQSDEATASGSAMAVVLGSFADAVNHVAYGAFAQKTGTALTAGGDYDEIHNLQFLTPNTSSVTQWMTGEDTSVDATGTDATEYAAIAAEIAIAVASASGGRLSSWVASATSGRMFGAGTGT
jgi:hypothetical protein